MITPEQKELADYVKQVHLSLRCKTRYFGAEKAWKDHLKNEETLRNYAIAMKKLAENYWSVNNQGDLCRIEWVINHIVDYFQQGLREREIEKEERKLETFVKKGLIRKGPEECKLLQEPPYKVLDVGSCYNPFGKFNFLEVYPIDLYPAVPEVKKCNFLETEVTNSYPLDWFHKNLSQIPNNFFDVVVFSLFLEYLPSPKQRYVACVKAYESLKPNGLLLIITPDSKHAGANARLMKAWKIAAAQIGFVRTRLEKLKYLYCMSFRKSPCREYPSVLYTVKTNPEEMFLIPQDSVDYKLEEEMSKNEGEESSMKELFNELPFS